jgi:hypothetical protein
MTPIQTLAFADKEEAFGAGHSAQEAHQNIVK